MESMPAEAASQYMFFLQDDATSQEAPFSIDEADSGVRFAQRLRLSQKMRLPS